MIQSSLSSRNPYKLPKHRFLELRHYCLQYPEWKKRYLVADRYLAAVKATGEFDDPIGDTASYMAELSRNIKMVENAAVRADEYLAPFLMKAVTEGLSFDQMAAFETIYCGRNMFYDRYRRFFYILDLMKGM